MFFARTVRALGERCFPRGPELGPSGVAFRWRTSPCGSRRCLSAGETAAAGNFMKRMRGAESFCQLRGVFDEIDVVQKAHLICAFKQFQQLKSQRAPPTESGEPPGYLDEELLLERICLLSIPQLDPVSPFLAMRGFYRCGDVHRTLLSIELDKATKERTTSHISQQLCSNLLDVVACFIVKDELLCRWAQPMRIEFALAFVAVDFKDLDFYKKLLFADQSVPIDLYECCSHLRLPLTPLQNELLVCLRRQCFQALSEGHSGPDMIRALSLLEVLDTDIGDMPERALESHLSAAPVGDVRLIFHLLSLACRSGVQWASNNELSLFLERSLDSSFQQFAQLTDSEWADIVRCLQFTISSRSLTFKSLAWLKNNVLLKFLQAADTHLCRLAKQGSLEDMNNLTYLTYHLGWNKSSFLDDVAVSLRTRPQFVLYAYQTALFTFRLAVLRRLPQELYRSFRNTVDVAPQCLGSAMTRSFFMLTCAMMDEFPTKVWKLVQDETVAGEQSMRCLDFAFVQVCTCVFVWACVCLYLLGT